MEELFEHAGSVFGDEWLSIILTSNSSQLPNFSESICVASLSVSDEPEACPQACGQFLIVPAGDSRDNCTP